jgi:hypothetical protein
MTLFPYTTLFRSGRGEKLVVVRCYNAAGVYIPLMVIFDGVRIVESHKQNLPVASAVEMTLSDYIYEAAFLE